ncbi:glycosyltransferase involved in cell wall biosynthesis [Paucibacter oligotrophus]|uniref:Glycosyltransferase involved in cell wall biosynthesis n=1 Tax=Roseateles oligotrophus TaxID=1769250 RepID=A0A840L8Q4_9BURK|nr:glycosyltransferase [Roseateles oligotrophus]MBB4844141.1 glycosyltransferase involved in cell wall biosynthesis [Roseateles oligotrophus]
MIAYHFPPLAGSSGIQRTLRFAQQLPAHGWQPLVLSTHPRAYPSTSSDLLGEIPPELVVGRAFALDTARDLSLLGRYPGWLARPDRWLSWRLDGLRLGLQMIRRYRPALIWSTFPIASAHLIAADLQRCSGLPWVADFRDPMAHDEYPRDPKIWASYRRVEQIVFDRARHCTFTTPGALAYYRQRYPLRAADISLLENGYDEASFLAAECKLGPRPPGGPLILLHSGIVYPWERDPRPLFAALASLAATGQLSPAQLRLRFRGSAHDDELARMAEAAGAADFIELCPPLPYEEALAEMMSADALLLLQAANCNTQVPAKLYEYLRAGRPILALTDAAGDTAATLRAAGLGDILPLDSAPAIAAAVPAWLARLRVGTASLPAAEVVAAASRARRSAALAGLLEGLV